MIPSNALTRVFQIRYGVSTGTAFTIEEEGKQYLVTAAHVVAGMSFPFRLEIYHEKQWKGIELKLTGICSIADIAVFAPAFQLSPLLPLPPSSAGWFYGQDVYFLGFPFGIASEAGKLNRDFPLPFVKKACLSAFMESEKGAKVLFLDGHNNPGFSGGPVIFAEAGKPVASAYKVLGVVSGYRFAEEPTFHGSTPTPVTIRANTGIIICYDIKHAVDEIRKNPNGIQTKA